MGAWNDALRVGIDGDVALGEIIQHTYADVAEFEEPIEPYLLYR